MKTQHERVTTLTDNKIYKYLFHKKENSFIVACRPKQRFSNHGKENNWYLSKIMQKITSTTVLGPVSYQYDHASYGIRPPKNSFCLLRRPNERLRFKC